MKRKSSLRKIRRLGAWIGLALGWTLGPALGLTSLVAAGAQDTPPKSSSGALLPPSAPTKTTIFPLSEVRRGQRGVAYTVFEGVNPEPMEVEILGLLKDALGPGQDMVLARLHGAKPEYTGVVAGMSGSPVYIDGRLAGALSYRIGQFSKEPIAGITPIERMLEVKNDARAGDSPRTSLLRKVSASPAESPAATVTLSTSRWSLLPEAASITPIETPLVFGGFSQEAVERFGDRFRAMGLTPVAGLGGSDPTASQPEPLVPGSAVSAVLVRGDFSMSGTCTVTYVDATHLLACGHPITQFGTVSMPMTKAMVLATLPSPLNAFKIINTTETVGAFTEDRTSAILGRFGQQSRMIPVSVEVKNAGDTPKTVHFEVLDNKALTPSAMLVSVYQSLHQTNGAAEEVSYRVSGELTLQDEPAVKLQGIMAPNELNPAAINTALYINDRFGRLYENAAEQPTVTGLKLSLEAIGDHRTAVLEQVRVSRSEVHPGETIQVEATLHPYQAPLRVLAIPVTVPAETPMGELRLMVSDGAALDRILDLQGGQRRTVSLRDMVDQMNRGHANDRVYVTLLTHEAQAVLEGDTIGSVPLSMANVLEPLKGEQRVQLTGETAMELGSAATGYVASGTQVLTLHIR